MRKSRYTRPESPEYFYSDNFERRSRIRKKPKRKTWKTWALRSFLIILLIVLGYAGYVIYHVVNAVSKGYAGEQKISQYRQQEVNMKKDPFTILFIGVDQLTAEDEKREMRPDVLILAAINPKTKSVKLLSIPRDTRVEIANTDGWKDKINSAETWGRQKGIPPIENTRQTVENFLYGVPVDYYVKINFKGFIQLVDAVGGVDVNVERGFKMSSFDADEELNPGKGNKQQVFVFKEGPMHLNGEMALPYVRMRKHDPLGDYGRQKRQREVIQKILDKIVSFDSITRVEEITSAIGDNWSYSIPPSDFIGLLALYQEIPKQNIEALKLHATSEKIGKHWYEIVTKEERRRISNILKQHLEIPIENDLQKEGNG